MRRFIFILFTVILSVSIATQMEAQSLMQTAKKAEQRAKELKQQESALYNSIVDSKDLTNITNTSQIIQEGRIPLK